MQRAIQNHNDPKLLGTLGQEVKEFARQFPLPSDS
jgi:hypothetical protein